MNKRNSKLTKIVSLAAMLLPLAFSGSAVAAKGGNNGQGDNGQKGSITLASICAINADKSLTVKTIIMNTSSNPADAVLDSMKVYATEKGGGKWAELRRIEGAVAEVAPTFTQSPYFADCKYNKDCNEANIPVCPPAVPDGVSMESRSLNADIEVLIDGIHDNKEVRYECDDLGTNPDGTCAGETLGTWSVFVTNCGDDPETDVDEHTLLIIGNQDKVGAFCPQP